jgi:hypothetical protein
MSIKMWRRARPSSVRFAATFSQREKAFDLHRTKGFSLWEKLSPKVTDEGFRQTKNLPLWGRWHLRSK